MAPCQEMRSQFVPGLKHVHLVAIIDGPGLVEPTNFITAKSLHGGSADLSELFERQIDPRSVLHREIGFADVVALR